MKQIYNDIENVEKMENIGEFYPIKKSGYRNADFAYLREIPFGFIDEKILLIVLCLLIISITLFFKSFENLV